MLDRVGDEAAVATSLVRYAKGTRFPTHAHPQGEEFLVLDGTFSDEHGDYPAGTYVRNPNGTRHAPFSDAGCLLFVKLRQFDDADQRACVIDTAALAAPTHSPVRHVLHQFEDERVWLINARAGDEVTLSWHELVREVLSLQGVQRINDLELTPTAWMRLPAGHEVMLSFLTDGCVYAKTRHLQGRMNA